MSYLNRSPYLLLLLACLLVFTAGCDSLTGGAADVPALVRAEATPLTQVPAHFDRPLDPASVTTSAFVVTSALDNGRSGQQAPTSVRYVGGASNTAELTLRAPGLSGVPFTADYGTTYRLSIVDDDTGRNTTMVQATVRFPSLYRRDNATREALTVRGQRGFTAVLHGNWIY